MKLYEIDQAIMDCIDLETGEVLDVKRFESLQMDWEEKLESLACIVKNKRAMADAIREERIAFAKREQALRNGADRLEQFLQYKLQGKKLATPKVAISYRKSEALDITNENLVVAWAMEHGHNDLLTFTAPSASRTAVKKYLKESGDTVPGAVLVEKQNIQIK